MKLTLDGIDLIKPRRGKRPRRSGKLWRVRHKKSRLDKLPDFFKEEIAPVAPKKTIREMYKKEPVSKETVEKIMGTITKEVIEATLGPSKPTKSDVGTGSLGPKKPKKMSISDKIKKNFADTN